MHDPAWWQARRLLRAARVGTLASSADGHPFASLVTPATAPDGSVLLLLSDLAEHVAHLRADPRCALLLAGEATGPNPQTTPRLCLSGVAAVEPDPACRARWLAIHPYAALYAGFADFHLWRLRPAAGSWVGGFGRAAKLPVERLAAPVFDLPPPPGCAAHDADGCDLLRDGATRRHPWPTPAEDAATLERLLKEMDFSKTP